MWKLYNKKRKRKKERQENKKKNSESEQKNYLNFVIFRLQYSQRPFVGSKF